MHRNSLPALVFGFTLSILGCGNSGSDGTGGTGGSGVGTGGSAIGGSSLGGSSAKGGSGGGTSTGGTGTGGAGTGGTGTGGSAGRGTAGAGPGGGGTSNGGMSNGGMSNGGMSNGGMSSGGMSSGGMSSGGMSAGGRGGASTGGSAGAAAGSGGSGGKSAPVPSKGCGVMDGAKTLTTGGSSVMSALPTSTRLMINSGGMNREYIIDIPADYDPNKPYRLIFSWYQAYGSDTGNANGLHPANDGPNFDAQNYAYFGLHRESTMANDPVIFVAPAGSGNLPWDFNRDAPFFDDLLAKVSDNLCIDTSRVFSTGFSFGAMMSYALSITRQTKLRGVVAMAAANYSLPGEPTDSNAGPIAYMGTVGMSDTTCPYVSSDASKTGGKWCAITHANDNGCTIPATIPTTTVGSKKYLCYDFDGCKSGYPVKICTFDGPHTPSAVDDGSNTGDDGLKAFIPPLAWQFISQL